MANLNFKWGLHANLPQSLTNEQVGALFFTKDEGGLYLGVEAGKKPQRIQGVVQYYATLNDFKADVLPPYSEDVIYYIASENALVKWHGERVSADGTIKEEGKFTILNVTASEFNSAVADIAANTSNISTNTTNITGLRTDLGASDAAAGNATAFARIKQLENAVNALEELTGTGSGENSLSTRIANLESWRTTAESQISSLQSDLAGAQTTIGEHTTAINDLNTWKGTTDDTISGINGSIADLEGEDVAIKGRLDTAEGTLATATGNIATLQSDLGGVTSRVTTAEGNITTLGSDLNAVSGRVGQLETWKTTAAETIADQGTRLATAEGNITTINGNLTTLNANLATVQSAAQDLRDDLGNNDKSGTTAFGRIAALEQADVTAGNAANALAGRVQTLEGTAEDHEGRLDTAEGEIDSLQRDLATAQSDIATKAAASDVEALKGRVDGHDTDISNINTNIDEVEQDIADINAAIGDATNPAANTVYAAIKTNATDIAANASDIKENADAIKANQEDIADHEERIGEAETKITNIESLNTQQGTAITGLDGRLSTAEGDITNLKNDTATNKSDIQKLDEKFDLYQTVADATSQHAALKTDLENQLTSHINAANALVYVGGIDSVTAWDTIKAQDSSIGKTYVVSTSAVTLTINGVQTACYAGDLLIATAADGKSEVNGVLAANDIAWVHVKAGYNAELNDTLDVIDGDGDTKKKATVRFSSYPAAHDTNEESRGDLGKFSIVSTSNNLDVTVDGENINVAMVWDTF